MVRQVCLVSLPGETTSGPMAQFSKRRALVLHVVCGRDALLQCISSRLLPQETARRSY